MTSSWLSEALSFRAVVTPKLLCLTIIAKVIINEANSVACTMEALPFWYQSQSYEFLLKVISS